MFVKEIKNLARECIIQEQMRVVHLQEKMNASYYVDPVISAQESPVPVDDVDMLSNEDFMKLPTDRDDSLQKQMWALESHDDVVHMEDNSD